MALLTTSQVAKLLGVSPNAVRALTAFRTASLRPDDRRASSVPEDVRALLERRAGQDDFGAALRAAVWRRAALAVLRGMPNATWVARRLWRSRSLRLWASCGGCRVGPLRKLGSVSCPGCMYLPVPS
jgi:hypothetical protein